MPEKVKSAPANNFGDSATVNIDRRCKGKQTLQHAGVTNE